MKAEIYLLQVLLLTVSGWVKRHQQEVLEEFWPALFEAMLEGWVRDEALWPKDRTPGMFQEWFEISDVFDCSGSQLVRATETRL